VGPPANIAGVRVNDQYRDQATDDIYSRGSGAWTHTGNIHGSPGAPGQPGAPGPPGPPGPPGGTPPPTPPPSSGIPAIPTSLAGFSITNTYNFAGLTRLPSGMYAYGGYAGGDPKALWQADHLLFLPDRIRIVTSGPLVLPNGNTGYISAGFGTPYEQIDGRTDVCVILPNDAGGSSAIGLNWPDDSLYKWPLGGEEDFLETGGASPLSDGWNVTTHYANPDGTDNNPQKPTLPSLWAATDWTQAHVFSLVAAAGVRTYLLDGVTYQSIANANLPLTKKSLRFQMQWLGWGTPTPPCPFDIFWAQQYQPA
jgi:hypothetical protein